MFDTSQTQPLQRIRSRSGVALLVWRCAQLLRRTLGALCLMLGILGALLPLIPGWPFALLAVLLLGPRDPWLRQTVLACRQILRRFRRVRQRQIRWLACTLSRLSGRLWRALLVAMVRSAARWHT